MKVEFPYTIVISVLGHLTVNLNSSNVTLNLLAGLIGVLYVNTTYIDGPSNTIEFLNFFDDASKAT